MHSNMSHRQMRDRQPDRYKDIAIKLKYHTTTKVFHTSQTIKKNKKMVTTLLYQMAKTSCIVTEKSAQ